MIDNDAKQITILDRQTDRNILCNSTTSATVQTHVSGKHHAASVESSSSSVRVEDNRLWREIRLGNIYGFTGGNYAGNVYDKRGLCPAMNAMGGGNRQPMIVVKM